jgi:hypothetical protein
MGPKPFYRLEPPRVVTVPDFPQDLAQFYAEYEAVEFEGSDYGSLFLHPLRDVERWRGLDLYRNVPEGWEEFDCFLIGYGCSGARLVYVLNSPNCQPEAILAIGGGLDWEGGTGPFTMGNCIVLGASLFDWLRYLEEFGWWEHGVGYGIPELPVERQRKLRAYYLALNPNIEWPEPE